MTKPVVIKELASGEIIEFSFYGQKANGTKIAKKAST